MTTFDRQRHRHMMRTVRTRGTAAEQRVRAALDAMGISALLNDDQLPGRPDLVLVSQRLAIFVHGCFWHGHSRCDRGTRKPKTNASAWAEKVRTNQLRDARVRRKLRALGWRTSVVWECETRDAQGLIRRLHRKNLQAKHSTGQ